MLAALEGDSPRVARHLEKVPAWFREWEDVLSRFKGDSELSHINNNAGVPVRVSQMMWDVLLVARRAYQQSDGLVSPTLLSALEAAGYDKSFELLFLGEEKDVDDVAPQSSFDAIEMDENTRSIRLPQGMRLDLGGVAKGWAAHTAMLRLKIYGAALVNAGGDIAVSGLQSGGIPWEIGVTDPQKPEQSIRNLAVGRCGIATSGRDFHRWQKNGVWQHHIIDPRTNRPSRTDLLAVTVVAPDVWEAETAAKVVFILGSKEGLAWLEARPALAGFLICEDGRTISSRRLTKSLRRVHGEQQFTKK
jgi:thiamine biosynthesis lipoprotein